MVGIYVLHRASVASVAVVASAAFAAFAFAYGDSAFASGVASSFEDGEYDDLEVDGPSPLLA
jgi:hypothetical protein